VRVSEPFTFRSFLDEPVYDGEDVVLSKRLEAKSPASIDSDFEE